MDACLKIYDESNENSDFGSRQGKRGERAGDEPESVEESPGIIERSIREFTEIMKAHPVSAYLSQDGMDAGVLCQRQWKHENWEIYSRFSKIFFGPAHGEICDLYEDQFKKAAALHGKG